MNASMVFNTLENNAKKGRLTELTGNIIAFADSRKPYEHYNCFMKKIRIYFAGGT